MADISNRTHPIKDGWIILTLGLKKAPRMTDEECRAFAAFTLDGFKADPANYEIALGEHKPRSIKIAIKRKSSKQ